MPFLIADRWQGVSPADVGDWDVEMVRHALDRMRIEGVVDKEKREADERRAQRRATGAETLEGFEELE